MAEQFRFRILRYAPNRASEEFYNIAVLLYGPRGNLVDARFAPDFLRLRCHPLADLAFLHELRREFEDRRLAGEDFSGYVEHLAADLSQSLAMSEEMGFLGEDAVQEMERLSSTFLATPRRREIRDAASAPDTRRGIQHQMRATFRLYHLLERLESDVPVGGAISPRFRFHIDYAYRPNGDTHYLHALSLKNDLSDASRLCFVFDRLRAQNAARLSAVVADKLPDDTEGLLRASQIEPWRVSRLDELAVAIRTEMGLG